MKDDDQNTTELELAKSVRKACIEAAREGFKDAAMSGLCVEGAMEAAISAMQNLELKKLVRDEK